MPREIARSGWPARAVLVLAALSVAPLVGATGGASDEECLP